MMEITYKEFFEKSKEKPFLKRLILECFSTAIKMTLIGERVFPNKPQVDSGEIMLNALDALCKLEDVILTGRDEMSAEYVADIINHNYRALRAEQKHRKEKQK